jgi:hypothetical protein
MAAATTIKTQVRVPRNSIEKETIIQLNNLITAFDVVTAKLDADGGVTDTNYSALATGYSKIGNAAGTAITAQ